MPASHRLDLLLVPVDPRRDVDDGRALLEDLVADGTIARDGAAGPRAGTWCPGGFARVILDRPPVAPDGLAFHGNLQGGFRASCPSTGRPIAPAFAGALARWRAGGERTVACPACSATHALEELEYAPPAAFGPWAVVTADAGAAALAPEGLARAERWIGRFALVLRRT